MLKQKKTETFRCSATIQKICVLCAQRAPIRWNRHDRRDWHSNSMTLPEELDPNECKT